MLDFAWCFFFNDTVVKKIVQLEIFTADVCAEVGLFLFFYGGLLEPVLFWRAERSLCTFRTGHSSHLSTSCSIMLPLHCSSSCDHLERFSEFGNSSVDAINDSSFLLLIHTSDI